MEKNLRLPTSSRAMLQRIIFGTDSKAGRLFDIILLWIIVASIIVVMFDSVKYIEQRFGLLLYSLEWIFTILFTIEYTIRLYISDKPNKYAFSFFGAVDLLALLPTYLSLAFSGTEYLLVIRSLRLLRVFRVLKLARYSIAAKTLMEGIKQSKPKIAVFLGTVITVVIVMGAIMYLVEGEENGFTSIPRSIYWAIVTMTTVGYGDIAPKTIIGQSLAAFIMILGYALIAVPTGIVTVSLSKVENRKDNLKSKKLCKKCHESQNDSDAKFCKTCGKKLT